MDLAELLRSFAVLEAEVQLRQSSQLIVDPLVNTLQGEKRRGGKKRSHEENARVLKKPPPLREVMSSSRKLTAFCARVAHWTWKSQGKAKQWTIRYLRLKEVDVLEHGSDDFINMVLSLNRQQHAHKEERQLTHIISDS